MPLQTKREKHQFINDLITNVRQSLVDKLDRVPEEWDGIELRQWIADAFADEVNPRSTNRTRTRAYKNAVIVNNL